jgi:hypothetical protein
MGKLKAGITILKARSVTVLAAVFFLLTGAFTLVPATAAHAIAGDQFCWLNQDCLNAWSGGPAVKVNTENSPHDKFTVINAAGGGGYFNIEYVGTGSYTEHCIGDYGNNPSDAKTGLVGGCGTTGIGWGGNFTSRTCGSGNSAGLEFYDVHWGGWLSPSSAPDIGTYFYLNSATPHCFVVSPA